MGEFFFRIVLLLLHVDDSYLCVASSVTVASPVLDISVESFSEDVLSYPKAADAVTVWLCFAQEDGSIHTLKCSASSSKYSVLEALVIAAEGKQVNVHLATDD